MSGRMTRSLSRNVAMDMPPLQPQAFHGYAGYAPTAGTAGPSSRQQSSWDRYIPQPEDRGSSWQSGGSSEWDQPGRMNWAYASGSSSSGAPPLFAARRLFSARGYRDLSQGLSDLNIESATSMIGHSRPRELSTNTSKTPRDITHNNKQITKPPWNCFKSSIRTLKHSTGTMGITLHPVSNPAWGEESPKVTCIVHLHVSFLSSS